LAVVNAAIWSYRAAHHRFPWSLKELGNPCDPNTGLPYQYRMTDSRSFTLKAIKVPGMDTIDLVADPHSGRPQAQRTVSSLQLSKNVRK
jgi:hypothetical protein